MGKNINIDKIREDLIRQKKEIEEKLDALTIVEKIANILTPDINEQNEFNDMTIIASCQKIFNENPNKEFLISEIISKLMGKGVQLPSSSKSAYGTVSSTLKRLAKKGTLEKRLSKNKSLFRLKKL